VGCLRGLDKVFDTWIAGSGVGSAGWEFLGSDYSSTKISLFTVSHFLVGDNRAYW
jgi:hypothetical protein